MGARKGSKLAAWRPLKWTDAQYGRVLEILRDNPDKTERWIFSNLIGADLPGRLNVQQRRRKDAAYLAKSKAMMANRPKFIKPVITEKQRASWIARRKDDRAAPMPRPAGQLRKGLLAIEAYAVADRAVSRRLEPHFRDDARSDLVVALLSGLLQPGDAGKAARGFEIQAQRWDKRMSFLSLDSRTYGDDDDAPAFVDTFTTDSMIYEAVF